MILLAHLLFGAAIGSAVKNIPIAIILAFLSHYFLDFFPHVEYSIENAGNKNWRKALPDILKIALDFFLGILFIFIFSSSALPSRGQAIIYVCAFIAIVPDGLTILNRFFPNKILKLHDELHRKKIHFLKYKKISNFWRIATQVTVIIVSVILLKF